MVKYILIPCLLFLGLHFANLSAQDAARSHTLLWKIEGKKVKSDSYLFGTIHLMDKEQFWFPKELDSMVRNSEQIVMEIADIDPSKALGYLTLEKGSFFDFFTPVQTDSILQWAETELSMKPDQFRLLMGKMKPFVVVQMATQMTLKGETASYELTFQSIAKETELPTIGLETVEEQMGFFDQLDSVQQCEMVMESIRDFAKNDSIMALMQRTYLSQDLEAMHAIISESGGSISSMQETLLDNRNKKWISKIKKLIGNKDTFIAVGAGHLGGPNGVIRLLEEEGYVLKPVWLMGGSENE